MTAKISSRLFLVMGGSAVEATGQYPGIGIDAVKFGPDREGRIELAVVRQI